MISTKKAQEYDLSAENQFWIRKMRALFRRLDKKGHGFLKFSDFLRIATDVMDSFTGTYTDKGDQILNGIVILWFEILSVHVEGKEKSSVTDNETTFIKNLKKGCENEGVFKLRFQEIIVDPFFNAADEDNDGQITNLQFKSLLKAFNAPETSLESIFSLVDEEKVGKIGKTQFENIMTEFFFSECPKSRTAALFGKLFTYKKPEEYEDSEFGPIWEGKMRTMFRRFNIRSTSTLKSQAFIQIAKNIANRGRLDKVRARSVLRSMLNVWVKWVSVGKEGKHFEELTEKEFIHNLRAIMNGSYKEEIDQFGWTFFKSMEGEGNGFVTLQEFRNLQEAWGVGREESEAMFKVLDTDKDGKLSSDEYMTGWVDYFLGNNSRSPYRGFFGPVITKFEAR